LSCGCRRENPLTWRHIIRHPTAIYPTPSGVPEWHDLVTCPVMDVSDWQSTTTSASVAWQRDVYLSTNSIHLAAAYTCLQPQCQRFFRYSQKCNMSMSVVKINTASSVYFNRQNAICMKRLKKLLAFSGISLNDASLLLKKLVMC